jgi:uncharacterized membrane protein YbjE (DUF340 family)
VSSLLYILTLLAALCAGGLAGRLPAAGRVRSSRGFAAARTATLFLLIFTMGFRIGRTPEAVQGLGTIGLAALAFSALGLAGTFAVLSLLFWARRAAWGMASHPSSARLPFLAAVRDPVVLLLLLAAGTAVGRFLHIIPRATGQGLITVVLYVLLFVIGLGLSGGGLKLRNLAGHPELILIPVGTAAGSLLGGVAAGALLGMRPGTSLSLSAGFGWYSLSGVILTRIDGAAAGSIAFLSNMFREAMALVLIPLLARSRFPYLAIGAGGATAMDVTLPLIEKCCGPRSVAFAMASGGLLSLSVPILVPLLHQVGG